MKKLLMLLMCGLLLTGCSQNKENTEINNIDSDVNEITNNSENTKNETLEENYNEETTEYTEETIEDDGMMDFTMYTGDVVSVAYDGLTRVALDKDQIIPVDTMEYILEDGTTFHIPANSIPESINDYDTLLSNSMIELKEAEKYRDHMQRVYVYFPNTNWSAFFFLDNENNEDIVDGTTLPVTYMQTTFEDPITINGFVFNENTFAINDLVDAWGNPLFAHVDTLEGTIESVDYYWRYNNGYVIITIEEEKLYGFYVYEWDTYAADYNYITEDIPRLNN